jgi:hypothetical protein
MLDSMDSSNCHKEPSKSKRRVRRGDQWDYMKLLLLNPYILPAVEKFRLAGFKALREEKESAEPSLT